MPDLHLTQRELDVMSVLWDLGEATVTEVRDRVDPSLAYTGISSMIRTLERWKARHPDAASHLAVDHVLVDSMRGRSSTWTRIRVNLRNVSERIRPSQETPDPDDDPTRAWREARRKRR